MAGSVKNRRRQGANRCAQKKRSAKKRAVRARRSSGDDEARAVAPRRLYHPGPPDRRRGGARRGAGRARGARSGDGRRDARDRRPAAVALARARLRRTGGDHRLAAGFGRQRQCDGCAPATPRFRRSTPRASSPPTKRNSRPAACRRPKMNALKALAEATANGLDLAGLAALEAEAAHDALIAVKGVGPWTADLFLLFCLGHPDAFPAGDLALQEAARLALGLRNAARRAQAGGDRRALAAVARRRGADAVGVLSRREAARWRGRAVTRGVRDLKRSAAGAPAGPSIVCLAAILRERNSNSRTARKAAAGGGALRASLTSNSSRAPLRQANNGQICIRTRVSYDVNPDTSLTSSSSRACAPPSKQ